VHDRKYGGSRGQLLLRQLRAVAQLGQDATRSTNLVSLLQRATELVALEQPVELCGVLQLMPDRTHLVLVAGVGWADGLAGAARLDADVQSQAGFTLLERETVLVDDLLRERRFSASPLLLEHGARSGMGIAILVSGRPWGVLGAHACSVRRFTQDDAQFLRSVAQILAATIERLAMQQAVLDSIRQRRELQPIADLESWVHDPVTDRPTCSDQGFTPFRTRPQRLGGRKGHSLAPVLPQDRERYVAAMRADTDQRVDVVRVSAIVNGRFSLIAP